MDSITTKGSAPGATALTGASVEVESRSRSMRAYYILEYELDSLTQNFGSSNLLYTLAGIGTAVIVALYEAGKVKTDILYTSLVVAGLLILAGFLISRRNKSIAKRIKDESESRTTTIKEKSE